MLVALKRIFKRSLMPHIYNNFLITKDSRELRKLVSFYNIRFNYTDYKLKPGEAWQICRSATRLNADLWKSINPKTEEEVNLFYKITLFYIFESTYVWMDSEHRRFLKKILRHVKGKVLDYGGGIGRVALFLSTAGLEAYYTDVPGITKDFAEFLFKGSKVRVLNQLDPEVKFDTIVCREVIEHVLNPEAVLKDVAGRLNKGGNLIITNLDCQGPTEDSPMHFKVNIDYEGILNSVGIYRVTSEKWLWQKADSRYS